MYGTGLFSSSLLSSLSLPLLSILCVSFFCEIYTTIFLYFYLLYRLLYEKSSIWKTSFFKSEGAFTQQSADYRVPLSAFCDHYDPFSLRVYYIVIILWIIIAKSSYSSTGKGWQTQVNGQFLNCYQVYLESVSILCIFGCHDVSDPVVFLCKNIYNHLYCKAWHIPRRSWSKT